MINLLQEGNSANIPVKQFLLDSEEDMAAIPENAPAGSIVMILNEQGLTTKMKSNQGEWINI